MLAACAKVTRPKRIAKSRAKPNNIERYPPMRTNMPESVKTAIRHGFIEFIGVNISTKDFQTGLFVFLQKGRASVADEESIGQYELHCVM